jgi:hypothetical protein
MAESTSQDAFSGRGCVALARGLPAGIASFAVVRMSEAILESGPRQVNAKIAFDFSDKPL